MYPPKRVFWQGSISTSHYSDVIMGVMASQITSLTIVYSSVYSSGDQGNIKAPRHWTLCWEFTDDRGIPRTKGQLRGKCFHLMTSSCRFGVGVSINADSLFPPVPIITMMYEKYHTCLHVINCFMKSGPLLKIALAISIQTEWRHNGFVRYHNHISTIKSALPAT